MTSIRGDANHRPLDAVDETTPALRVGQYFQLIFFSHPHHRLIPTKSTFISFLTTGNVMSGYVQRFIEELQLKGLSSITLLMYTRFIEKLTNYYQKWPEKIIEEVIRRDFLSDKNIQYYLEIKKNLIIIANVKKDFLGTIHGYFFCSREKGHPADWESVQ